MLDEHKEAINNFMIEMDDQLQSECYTFIIKNSKPQAEEKCNDDVVMADAICVQMLKEESKNKQEKKFDTVPRLNAWTG